MRKVYLNFKNLINIINYLNPLVPNIYFCVRIGYQSSRQIEKCHILYNVELHYDIWYFFVFGTN